jgi:two-component system, chemotaxis family, sensor kinase CheA
MSELQHEVLKLQLIPIEVLFGAYPRLVRDTAAKQERRVKLVLAGGEIGLDKRALDALNDPLLHLIRNAVGHGIEAPEARKKAGKSEEGTIRIEARRERDRVIVTVADDGGGIDPAIAGEPRPPDGTPELFAKLLDVICRPGFSTRRSADDVAGRGVGMEVVRAGVGAIGGRLSLASTRGRGTTFTLEVPLTLSIVQSLLFEIGPTPYAVPLAQVREIVRLPAGAIHRLDRFEVFSLHGGIVPLIDYPFESGAIPVAGMPAELPEGRAGGAEATAVVIEAHARPVALRVDALVGRQETIVKPLPTLLRGVPGLTGTTILGSGRVAFVLDLAAALER